MTECNVDEILKQMKTLDNLKQLKENLSDGTLATKYPELSNIDVTLDAVIAKQEAELQAQLDVCGNIDTEEVPETVLPELSSVLPELDIPEV